MGRDWKKCTSYGGQAGVRLSIAASRNLGSAAVFALAVLALPACDILPEKQLPPGTPALHRAVALDEVAEVKRSLGPDVNARGPYGWTPLHYAAVYNAARAAEVLLGRRAHLDALDQTGATPLHWAARRGHREMVDLLLKQGAEVRARNRFDMTPLHEATTVEVALALLARGADLHARDVDGMTPLHTASTRAVAQFLIQKGADVDARAKDGRSPMDMPPTPRPRVK
jgi:ankyrin repeat protein